MTLLAHFLQQKHSKQQNLMLQNIVEDKITPSMQMKNENITYTVPIVLSVRDLGCRYISEIIRLMISQSFFYLK